MAEKFILSSTSIEEGRAIPEKFTYNDDGCFGENISPELRWEGAPAETKSFAIICHDPDAPTDHGWYHWAVINIPPEVTQLEEGASNENSIPPEAREIMTDYKVASYGGPCPPQGDRPHRYVFTVYALNTEELPLDVHAKAVAVKEILEENCLAKASLTANYARAA